MTVLVVDDDPCVVSGLVAYFESEEIHASAAYDRESAEEMIAGHFFPVVLADFRLKSEADGMELLRAVRRISPRSRIATLTGYADHDTEERLLALGASMVLHKPMPADEIVAVVRQLLAGVDEQLDAAATNDDIEALYAGVTRVLHGIARHRYGLPIDDAEEIVQETWCLFLERRAGVKLARPWLAGTTVNLCRQRIQSHCRARDREAEMTDEPAATFDDSPFIVREALGQLDPRSRTLCELIGLERLSYAEVSKQLAIPLGSVGPLYQRAKTRLRDAVMA